jgi:hypothetical protein
MEAKVLVVLSIATALTLTDQRDGYGQDARHHESLPAVSVTVRLDNNAGVPDAILKFAEARTAAIYSRIGVSASADQPEPLTLAVWVRDTAQVPDDVLTGARTEVTRIFGQVGVETVWPSPSSASANTDASREPRLTIAILSYDQVERLHPTLTRDGVGVGFALNSSPTTRANVAYVFYHRVKLLTGANGVHLAPVLGAAMAHEIGHLLLDNAHSQAGLMRADWTKEDLQLIQRSELFFTAKQAALIRSQVAGLWQR